MNILSKSRWAYVEEFLSVTMVTYLKWELLSHNVDAFLTIDNIAELYTKEGLEMAIPPHPGNKRDPTSYLVLSGFALFFKSNSVN